MKIPSLTATAAAFLLATTVTTTGASGSLTPRSWEEALTMANTLVDKMSLEQKVNITTGAGYEKTLCVGQTGSTTNPDFPSLCLQDGPLGVRIAHNVTAGLSGITASQSWDKEALRKRGEYMGKEFREKGAHFQLGPDVEVMRSPFAGRIFEGFGEDPYLSGVAGVETTIGIQSQGVIATGKHYILNNQEHNRMNASSVVDERTLREVYAYPFARVIEAGIGSIMCSYNRINGTYSCENDATLNKLLKEEMGFQGVVQSDWGATHSTVDSVNHGLDVTMPGDINLGDGLSYFGKNLTEAVKRGDISEERVTDMARRTVASYYKMRQDEGFPEISINSFNESEAPEVLVQGNHGQLVREMGAAAVVLLQNKNKTLPLSDSLKKIAIVGSDAGISPDGINCGQFQACDNGTLAMGYGSGAAYFPYLVSPYEGIKNRASDNVEIVHTFDDWNTDAAAALAKDADVALVFSNSDSGEQVAFVDGNDGDRNNLTLWHNGDNLIKAVADANPNTVVVIHSVGPVTMPWVNHPNIKAIVWPGLPGQESGNSLADVIFGDVNPSGRLPYTIAKKESDYNAHIDLNHTIEFKEKLLVGYKYFDAMNIEPLFEFGFGLSYTDFKYSNLKVKTSSESDTLVTATVSVKNSGDMAGDEIVQAYISFPESAGEPPKLLRGFEKVHLKKGRRATVSFDFSKTELSIYDLDKADWVIPSGEFTLHIGASSRDIRQSATFTLN